MTATVLVLMLVAAAPAVDCPEGTLYAERKTAEAREVWCHRKDGTRHGPRHAWHADGNRWFEGEYSDGKRQGRWSFWHANGKLRSQGTYRTDKRHGPSKHWHDNGQKALEGRCEDGVEDGIWKSFWPNGKPELLVTFAKGRVTSTRYSSRRGLPVQEDAWLAEKVRGVRPGTSRYDRARKQYAPTRLFAECRD